MPVAHRPKCLALQANRYEKFTAAWQFFQTAGGPLRAGGFLFPVCHEMNFPALNGDCRSRIIMNCVDVCPKNLNPAAAIGEIRSLLVQRAI